MIDKAKAYDEALERARKQRDDYQKELDKTDKNSQLAGLLRAGISAIELALPELTESEDEKIRKSLIEFLTDIKEISESGRTVWAVRKEDVEMCKSSIAYLEKQKEQKSAEWSKEDEINRAFILESLEDQIRFCKKDAEGAYYAKQIRTAQNWLKSFKSHWKPTKEHIDAIEECLEFYAESTDTYRHLKSLLSELVKL